jgi:hypothetical protein
MTLYSHISQVGAHLDDVALRAGASCQKDRATLLEWRRRPFSQDEQDPLRCLRISVEEGIASGRIPERIESITVKIMTGHFDAGPESLQDAHAFLTAIQERLPLYGPEIVHALSRGCIFICFDSSLDADTSWQWDLYENEVSAHECIEVHQRAASVLANDLGCEDRGPEHIRTSA